MKNNLIAILVILILVVFAGSVVYPKGPDYFGKELKTRLGLDLQGGVQLTYEIDTAKLGDKVPTKAQEEAIDIISRRVDDLGVAEPKVQGIKIGDRPGIIVELPGIKDIEEAKRIIGKTAQLKFYELDENNNEKETDLTGSDVKKAEAGTDRQSTGFSAVSPVIYLEFTKEGGEKFEQITKRNINKPLITKLDDAVINQATVRSEIAGGKAQIEGIESLKEAKETARLINEGALPAPINLVQESFIGASLGKDAIEKSLIAGLIGLLLVAVFMIVYYRFLGLIAIIALLIYALLVGALFKLIPVTLTLAGIAGFIFSIGIAVDANILVFERFKEEKEKGIPISQALENGFSRSWPSIRDSNISSLITAVVLFYLSSGTVKGFALTLAIGIIVSMFTAIIVTRNILRLFIKNKPT
ncbi:MAG: protein translocase subunit SecD [Candidatus Berkelbacteria bacterium]|nr:protein translocase subunit SecD [Candidatus Berkelbacteria bacterium]